MEKTLFDKTILSGIPLKNRLFRSATWEALTNGDGTLPDALIGIYKELAEGGVGAIITGAIDITGDDNHRNIQLVSDEQAGYYKPLVKAVKENDCAIIAQLSLGNDFLPNGLDVNEADESSLCDVVDYYVKAAKRSKSAGFDGIQLHAAHGYFLSRFINPAYNHRNDQYGGSPENRGRLLVKILKGIQAEVGQYPVLSKMNCNDDRCSDSNSQNMTVICKMLSQQGIAAIEVSGSDTSRTGIKPYKNEGFYAKYAEQIKETVPIPVILVGGNRSVENMNQLLTHTQIDYFSLSRPLIREPDLPKRWANGDLQPALCVSCNGCYQTTGNRCIFQRDL